MKKNRILALLLSVVMTATMCGGCGKKAVSDNLNNDDNEPVQEETTESLSQGEDKNTGADALVRNFLISSNTEALYDTSLTPCVEKYYALEDLCDVYNVDQFEYILTDELKKRLSEDYFFIDSTYDQEEFYEVYEGNRYGMIPSFITVDSLMHVYHLYFAHLLRSTEKESLYNELQTMTSTMYDESVAQYEALKGSEWEEAAATNVQYFAVAASLLGTDVKDSNGLLGEAYMTELSLIDKAEGVFESALFGGYEDYSQYKVRGYYDTNENLKKYFKAMMWYGRRNFNADSELLNRCAVLMTLGMNNSALESWEKIYTVTSFFAGASDDLGYYEYYPAITSAFGNVGEYGNLVGKDKEFGAFCDSLTKMAPPRINSIPVWDGDETVIPGFRFMGQRFTVDETVFANLTYSNLEENAAGDKRMLPDTLDMMAVLGSDEAYSILKSEGDIDYPEYDTRMEAMKQEFDNNDGTIWNASLYASWLNTLRPLLNKKGEGYPMYMQSEKWARKDLETFAGSYAELKHDTILYTKQVMAEMGGGDMDEYDDRGYVDPEIEVYARFAKLSQATKEGLERYGMLSDEAKEDLDRLTTIAKTFVTISEKELKNELLTEDEYEFIRCYGGDLEHFWLEVSSAMASDGEEGMYGVKNPCPVIADIATDPNGTVLEVGTGGAQIIYILINVDGQVKIAKGMVYSFYQFEQPIAERLTDSEWRTKLGMEWREDVGYAKDEDLVQPKWTQDYRIKRTFEY